MKFHLRHKDYTAWCGRPWNAGRDYSGSRYFLSLRPDLQCGDCLKCLLTGRPARPRHDPDPDARGLADLEPTPPPPEHS